jgi:adenylate kinase
MRISLTGTPGTGKTRLSKILAKRTKFKILYLNKAVKKHKLYSGYDKERKTYIADMRKVTNFVKKKTKEGNWIIDSHLSHLLSPKIIDKVIVLRCDPKILEERLKRKNWNNKKIQENVEAEMIGLIAWEARKHKKVLETESKRIKNIIRFINLR